MVSRSSPNVLCANATLIGASDERPARDSVPGALGHSASAGDGLWTGRSPAARQVPCGRISAGMDPSRKRAIRLTVALSAALLLASALIYTSFTAGNPELTAGQLLKRAQPGQSYIL